MSKSFDADANGHPEPHTLLLFLDGELDAKTAAATRDHLAGCWECASRLDQLRSGIVTFMKARERYLRSLDVPVPRPRRLHQALARQTGPSLGRGDSGSRPLLIAASIAASVLFGAALYLSQPARLEGSDLLARAAAVHRKEQHRTMLQRVRIRQGIWSVTREIQWGSLASSTRSQAPEWTAGRMSPAINWSDPLDPRDFANWRARQRDAEDEIQETPGLTVLRTRAAEGGAVKSVAISLDASQWRAVRKDVEYDGYPPLEIVEVGREYRPVEPAPQMAARARSQPTPHPQPEPVFPADPEAAEALARSILLQPGLVYRRKGQTVVVELSTTLDDELRERLRAVPGLQLETGPLPEETAALAEEPALSGERHRPLLLESLVQQTGSRQNAPRFAASILHHHSTALDAAVLLNELAERYPPAVFDALPPPARSPIVEMVEATERTVSAEWRHLQSKAAGLDDGNPAPGACGGWQERSTVRFHLLVEAGNALSWLYSDKVTTEAAPPVEDLLETLRRIGTAWNRCSR